MTLKEKKAAIEEQKRQQAETRRTAKAQKTLTLLMMAWKSQLIENKMDDESISESMLAITVAEAKQAIKNKKFVRLILSQHNKLASGNINKQEFT